MQKFRFSFARVFLPLAAGSLVLFCVFVYATPLRATILTFEDLTLGQTYESNAGSPAAPDSFVTDGVPVVVGEFFLLPSGSTPGVNAVVRDSVVDSSITAGGSGNFLFMGVVNLEFDFGGPVSQLSFLFGEFGGDLNIRVNGVLEKVNSFFTLPATIGGAGVTVELLGSTVGGDLGRVTLTGNITQFSVGGEEFSIDDVDFILVPEPATMALAAFGLLALVIAGRRARRG